MSCVPNTGFGLSGWSATARSIICPSRKKLSSTSLFFGNATVAGSM